MSVHVSAEAAAAGLDVGVVEVKRRTKGDEDASKFVLVLTLNGGKLCDRAEFESREAAEQVAGVLGLAVSYLPAANGASRARDVDPQVDLAAGIVPDEVEV